MLDTPWFGNRLRATGYGLFTGVPCSFLTPLINYALNEADFVNVANEGEAVAVSAGANLGGRKAVVMFQNSGLTNALSPLASLIQPYQIPLLGFVTWRGEPGRPDAPQHTLMGSITTPLLDLLGIPWAVLEREPAIADQQLAEADRQINAGRSFFFVVRQDTFAKIALRTKPAHTRPVGAVEPEVPRLSSTPLMRSEALELVMRALPNALVVATTGYTGRELSEICDRPGNFYMAGSMGCASSIGLGLALARPDRQVMVVDGDGAALMRLGAWPAIARCAPANLLHVLLDNGCHESTGGQATLSAGVDFVAIARAAGYPQAHRVANVKDLDHRLSEWCQRSVGGLTMLVVPTRLGAPTGLGRPELPLPELANRFRQAAQS